MDAVRTANRRGPMAQSGEKHELGRIGDRKAKERSESLGSVKEFFERKRERTEEGEREEEGRAFQRSKKTPRSPINTKEEGN